MRGDILGLSALEEISERPHWTMKVFTFLDDLILLLDLEKLVSASCEIAVSLGLLKERVLQLSRHTVVLSLLVESGSVAMSFQIHPTRFYMKFKYLPSLFHGAVLTI